MHCQNAFLEHVEQQAHYGLSDRVTGATVARVRNGIWDDESRLADSARGGIYGGTSLQIAQNDSGEE